MSTKKVKRPDTSPDSVEWQWALPPKIASAVTIALWVLVGSVLVRLCIHPELYQWDFRVFFAAPRVLANGGNPYDIVTPLPGIPEGLSYLYPPIILYVLEPLNYLTYPSAYVLFFVVKLLAVVVLFRLWHRNFEPLNASWPMVAFMTFAFNSAILRDFAAGNVAIFEQVGIWTFFCLMLRERPYSAGAVLAITAQIKLLPIVLLGLLLIVGRTRGWKPFTTSLALFAALLSLNFLLLPEMTAHYLSSFATENPNLDERAELNPSSLSMLRDIAEFATDLNIAVAPAVANYVYLGFLGSVAAAAIWLIAHYWERWPTVDPKLLIYCGCLLFVLVMPRVKDYTYIIALIPALFAIRHIRLGPALPLLGVLLFLPPTDSYVPGLGRGLAFGIQSYMAWFIALLVLVMIAQRVERTVRHPSERL